MTYPGYTTVQTQALQDNAERLGLVWKKRAATIVVPLSDDPTGVTAIMDGDTVAINVYSLIGVPPVGSRVMCDIVPPSGIYVVGYIGATPGNLIGGKLYTTAATKASGVTAEVVPTDYTITINEPYNRFMTLHCNFGTLATDNNSTFLYFIRRGTIAGPIVAAFTQTIPFNTFGYRVELFGQLQTVGGTQTYVMTAQKVGGLGSVTILTSSDALCAFFAEDRGPISALTKV